MKIFDVKVQKESKETKLGIVLLQSAGTGQVLIKSINPNSLIGETDLVVGLEILSINGQDLKGKNATEAAQLLTESDGEVAIVATGTVATVKKSDPSTSVGISMKKVGGVVVVSRIAEDGLLKDSDLKVGDRITALNGVICPNEARDATLKIKDSKETVQIVAINGGGGDAATRSVPPVATTEKTGGIVVTVTKATKTTPVGITIGRNVKISGLVITKISDSSLFGGTELKVGHKLISINGKACDSSMTTKDAVDVVKATKGELTLVVEDSDTVPTVAVAAAATAATATAATAAAAASQPQKEDDSPPEPKVEAEEQQSRAVAPVVVPVTNGLTSSLPGDGQVTATAIKSSKDQKVGIRMKNRNGGVVISHIVDSSIFANSVLIPGMKIVSINGNPCEGGAYSAVELIKDLEGKVTIVASCTVVSTTKPTKDTKVGISFGKHKNGAVVLLSNDGLFASSDLEVGQKIVSLNDQECPEEVKDAITIVKECVGTLKIVAVENVAVVENKEEEVEKVEAKPVSDLPLGHVIASAKKEWKGSFGISMWSTRDDDSVYISKIDPEGVFFGTGLRTGMKVVSLNGTPCPPTAKEAIAMIKDPDVGKQLTVEAKYTVSKVKKPDQSTKLGLVLGQMDGYIIVYQMAKDSLFQRSDLQIGQTVVSINGEQTPESVQDAVNLMTSAESEVTIFAVKSFPEPKARFPESSWITETRTKEPSAPFGVFMMAIHDDYPRVVISKISPDSPFVDSRLREGQTVITINGNKVPKSAPAAIELMKLAGNKVTITVANLISTVKKETKNSPVGLTLAQVPGYVSVLRVAEKGLFSQTFLQEGQRVVSINGEEFGNDVSKAVKIINEADGLVKLVSVDVVSRASYRVPNSEVRITVTVHKKSKDTRVGFSVVRNSHGHIFVSGISKDGLLADSQLRLGQRIVSINRIPAPDTIKGTMDIVRGAVGTVTIVAATVEGQYAVAVEKESQDTKIGLGVMRSIQGHIVVSNISPNGPNGLLANSKLRVGQKIISLNYEKCPETTKAVMDRIREATDKLTIVASDIVAKAEKTRKEHGLGLGKLDDGSIVVCQVSDYCLFNLQVGQKIITINGEPVSGSLDDTINLLADLEGSVTIVALDTIERNDEMVVPAASLPVDKKDDTAAVAVAEDVVEPEVVVSGNEEEKPEETEEKAPAAETPEAEKETDDVDEPEPAAAGTKGETPEEDKVTVEETETPEADKSAEDAAESESAEVQTPTPDKDGSTLEGEGEPPKVDPEDSK